mmetsp:Transcript_34906/g.75366  ORF Transcript_34906/g.75366 Transcript_34906/m.75366 type:complete len:103 (+) Transcript_34906:511-819(+)
MRFRSRRFEMDFISKVFASANGQSRLVHRRAEKGLRMASSGSWQICDPKKVNRLISWQRERKQMRLYNTTVTRRERIHSLNRIVCANAGHWPTVTDIVKTAV